MVAVVVLSRSCGSADICVFFTAVRDVRVLHLLNRLCP